MERQARFVCSLSLALLTSAGIVGYAAPAGAAQATAAQATAAQAAAGDSGNAERGKALFVTNGCFACHGYQGQGGSYTGVRLAPDPLPWQAIAAFIRNPRGLNPPYLSWPFNVMPPFTSKMVSDRDVQDIYAYLKTIPGPTDLKNVPTFKK